MSKKITCVTQSFTFSDMSHVSWKPVGMQIGRKDVYLVNVSVPEGQGFFNYSFQAAADPGADKSLEYVQEVYAERKVKYEVGKIRS